MPNLVICLTFVRFVLFGPRDPSTNTFSHRWKKNKKIFIDSVLFKDFNDFICLGPITMFNGYGYRLSHNHQWSSLYYYFMYAFDIAYITSNMVTYRRAIYVIFIYTENSSGKQAIFWTSDIFPNSVLWSITSRQNCQYINVYMQYCLQMIASQYCIYISTYLVPG